ncbi:MAG: FAD-dependent oxidoreductase [Haloarculaceae archaeon]
MDLFEQTAIGETPVRNRAVFRAVRTNLADDGRPTATLNEHLAARARGGAGLVVGPAKMLVDDSASGPSYVIAHDDVVPALSETADAVHEADGALVGQLTHPGGEATGDWEMQPQLAPSAVASDSTYEMPTPMDGDDVERIQGAFAAAADRLERAGFDGVELAAGPYAVLRQFLSPKFNVREDAYGGDWKGRARFVNETLDRVQAAVDVPVGLHLSLSELEYGGYEFDDVPDLLAALEGFDYLSCTVGTATTFAQTHAGAASQPPGLVDAVETVVEHVDVPVMGRTAFTDLDDADALLDAGVDFVSFTRQLLADEATVERAADGDRPTRCIQCNQKCLEGVYGHAHGGHVECVVDPRTGREDEFERADALPEAAIPREVLVVGGGPAGMRFATLASRRGHDVTLREARDELGGQLSVAAQGVLEPFERAREDLEADLRDADVTVECGERVTPGDVADGFDAVVVATGAPLSTADARDFEGEVVDAIDVLGGTADPLDGVEDEEVLLIDENRWVITMQTGFDLAGRGAALEIVTEDHYPGFRTEQPNLPAMVAGLQAQSVTFTGNHEVESVADDGTVTLTNTLTGETDTRSPDTVVYAGRRHAADDLYLDLAERRDDVYRLGDAVSPRKLDRAYYDAEKLARRL